ncbi:MAG: hypothetical protein IJW71_01565 [Clostridia bacterium]|nr:hypothetical protein [Clostridia bacterium]
MKSVVYAGLAFIALILFMPTHGSYIPRNLPLLILLIALYLLYYAVRFIKYILLIRKTAELLKQHGYEIKRIRVFPFAARARGEYSLLAQRRGALYSFYFLIRKRRHYRYHFDSRTRLSLYESNRVMINSGRFYARRSNIVQIRRAAKHHLKWQVPADTEPTFVLLMNKFPDLITDAKTTGGGLGNGDLICDAVHLYDFPAFSERIEQGIFPNNG